jgi:hypothetical protein
VSGGPYLVSNPDDLHLTDEELEAKYPGLADEPAGLFRSTPRAGTEPARPRTEWQAGVFSADALVALDEAQS